MECKEITIARLVLGYLKNEKCRSAYKEFFRSSRHLQPYNVNSISRSKYIPTRFVGLTLEDILTEYFSMYQEIQGRLEVTNYYNECHLKNSLVDQLIYLLNAVHSSRASTPHSTPCPRSPGDSHLNESSPSGLDQISDIETTSVHNLPGNKHSSEEAYHKSIRRSKEKSFIAATSTDDDKNADIVVNSEVLAQTLLENKEFHEKIAQTINKVAEKQSKELTELDETIRTVVRETEEDPIFDKILDEIIDSAGIVAETNLDSDKLRYKSDTNENVIVHRNSGSQTQKSSDVIVFDGSLDKYLVSNLYSVNTQTIPQQNPLYINTASNLVVLPTAVTNMAAGTSVTNSQQYYLINKPPAVSCIVPPALLTEQDILAMPTVIVNDDRPPNKKTEKSTAKKKVSTIKPKGPVEVSSNVDIREFLRTYGPDEPPKTGLRKVIYPKSSTVSNQLTETEGSSIDNLEIPETIKENETNDDVNCPNSETAKENLIFTSTANSDAEKKLKGSDITEPTKCADSKDKNDKSSDSKKQSDSNKFELNTPIPMDTLKKSTPKSGSHVRNLDFSTPPKIIPSHKNVLKENESDKKNSTQKKQAVKSLFKQNHSSAELQTTWDTTLRATIVPDENYKREGNKRKRKMSPNKSKKKFKNQKKEKSDLNVTDLEGALLEAALKTPIKTDIKEHPESNNPDIPQISEKLNVECSTNPNIGDTYKDDNDQENVDCLKSKTILSPSKLNANKRTFVNNVETETNDKNKFVTPEMVNDKHPCPLLKANRNITPMLETPLRDRNVPKTPGIQTPMDISTSPLSNITPFTKMLEANLKGFDIGMLPTPNIPITPNFPPLTPNVDFVSPYSNRPTDYSTSSSYYQPSDSEQNKCLENQLLEIEKTAVKVATETAVKQCKSPRKSIIANEHFNLFNKNVIGKKNLNLMTRANPNSTSNSESSNEDIETDESFNQETNDTVILKKKPETPKRIYSLRARSATNYKDIPKNQPEVQENSEKKTYKKQKVRQTKRESKKISTASKKLDLDKSKRKSQEKKSPEKDKRKVNSSLNSSKETSISEKSANEELSKSLTREQADESKDIRSDVLIKEQCAEVNVEQKADTDSNKILSSSKGKEPEISKTSSENKCEKNEAVISHTKNIENTTKKEMFIKGKLPNSQQTVLKELEEKRKRTINKIKVDNQPPPKRIRNGKFKIKPIPNVSGRKRPRKSDSPKKKCQGTNQKISAKDIKILREDLNNSEDSDGDDNVSLHLNVSNTDESVSDSSEFKDQNAAKLITSTSDVEAKNLIENLKERGIHLVQTKPQNMKDPRGLDEEEVLDDRNSVEKKVNTPNKNILNANLQMNSSVEMEYTFKEELDIEIFEGENLHIIFDEMSKSTRTLDSFDIQELSKSYMGKLYIEEIDQYVDIPIKCTEFYTIFELRSSTETKTQFVGNPTNETQKKVSSKSGKTTGDNSKHMLINKDISLKETEPKSNDLKINDNKDIKCETLLKHLNVDSFLNKMYDT